ncbi:MAG: VWA domain-containing protein [Deltaproteobacteria bacterium]|nr:VWA domain-containing protein [Deltaproteobacteria bacterium]
MALSLGTWLDVGTVRPNAPARAHLVIEVVAEEPAASGAGAEGARAPSVTVLAIDVSGSMHGDPLDHVVRSVDRLLDALRPDDSVAVVAFSDGATRVVDPVTVDANGKRLVRQRVARLVAEGHTNVEAGLALAAEVLGPARDGRRRGVVLLSDGHPNVGAKTPAELRAIVGAHRASTSFSALGYGVNHAEDVLAAIGDAGGGGYEYVPDPATCARAFAKALGAQADVVASGIEIAIAPAEGTEIVKLLGGEPARFGREGLTLELPDMVPGARRIVVAEIVVKAPGSERFLAPVASVAVSWRRPGQRDGSSARADVTAEIADREPAMVREALTRVMLVRADRVREEARALADRAQWAAAAALLRKVLADIDAIPGYVSGDGSALADAYELLVDEAMAFERRPSAEQYANFRKSAIGSKLAAPAPPPSKTARGPASSRFLELTAGSYPEAYIVVKSGRNAGERHLLKDECVIGRSADAHVAIVSDGVSRRHAEIYALEGEFWACDLGSTNTTEVNGKAVHTAPVKLKNGDVLRVGDVVLVYEEPPKRSGP